MWQSNSIVEKKNDYCNEYYTLVTVMVAGLEV